MRADRERESRMQRCTFCAYPRERELRGGREREFLTARLTSFRINFAITIFVRRRSVVRVRENARDAEVYIRVILIETDER